MINTPADFQYILCPMDRSLCHKHQYHHMRQIQCLYPANRYTWPHKLMDRCYHFFRKLVHDAEGSYTANLCMIARKFLTTYLWILETRKNSINYGEHTWNSALLFCARYFAGKTTANIAFYIKPRVVIDLTTSQRTRFIGNAWQRLTILNSTCCSTFTYFQTSFLFNGDRYTNVGTDWNHVQRGFT